MLIAQKGNTKVSSNDFSIVDIYQDTFGRILIATWGHGVYLLDKETRQLKPFDLDLPSKFVRTMFQDKKGHYWIGTRDGLVVIDPTELKSRNIVADERNANSLLINNIFKVYQSDDSNIWVGTYGGGVSYHDPASQRFESYGRHPNESEGLLDASVYALAESTRGEIWVGTEAGGLSKFREQTKDFEHFEIIIDGQKNLSAINKVFRLTDTILLLATTNGIIQYDLVRGAASYFYSKDAEILNGNKEAVFFNRDSRGRILIGVRDEGIGVFELSSKGELREIKHLRINITTSVSSERIDGYSLLVITQDNGIFKIIETDTQKQYESSMIPNTKNLSVTDANLDWKGRLWIATWSNGIKIITSNGALTSLDEANGLPNNSVYSIRADETSNEIWAATNLGIVSINADSLEINHFRESDGLQGDEFNSPALISESGYLYFGGVNGFNRFYPNVVQQHFFVRGPKVTKLGVASPKMKNIEETRNEFSRSLLLNDEVEFNYDQMPFSLSFTSPQYVRPEDIEFRYRLVGLDENWILSSPGIRRATYTNLDPGTYLFKLQVRSKGAPWKNEVEEISIVVNSPWWATVLAKTIYALAMLLMIASVLVLYAHRRRKEILVQQAIQENEERLKLSLWGSGYEFWDWDIESGAVSRSKEFKKIEINCPVLSKDLHELSKYIHPKDLDLVREQLQAHIQGKSEHYDVCYRVVDSSSNGWRWIQDRGKVVASDRSGRALRMSGTQRDITDIKEKEEQFEMLGQAFKNTSDGVWIRDHEWSLVECNPAFERMTGFSLSEKKGEALWFPEISEQPENLLQRIRISIEEKGNWQGEAWAERKNNDPFPQKLSIDTLHDERGNIRYYVGVFSDITFHKRTEEEFRRLANYDSLTGLPNRACLYDRLNQTIDKSKRDQSRFAIFLVDIDNFKRINDSLGHSVGDILIKQVSTRLVNCNKEGDTVARIGGDEFVIIVEHVRTSSQVAAFAELLLKELNQPIFVRGQQLKLNFSIGITMAPDDGIVADKLIRNSDTAMYEAKKELENSYRFFSVEFNERARKRLALENALRKAIDNHLVELFYQPKVDLNIGKVVGVEALARWTDHELGFISPAEFIPLAEDNGLINLLGEQLLRLAVKQTKVWVDQGVMKGRTSVNLSAHQFTNRNFADEASRILDEVGLDAKYIELEITESACMEDIDETLNQIRVLKGLGFHLALDDFGTGFSSLSQLKTLPFDTLKVDKSFVDNIESNTQDAKVVKAIIDIAKTMDMEVVIEGVESKSQCRYLWNNRAYVVQGFYFSRPLKADLVAENFSRRWDKHEYLGEIIPNVTHLN